MPQDKNIEKYEVYRAMMENLSKAMRSEFYYQAIFIEYAIIEDRCLSALKHSGVKYLDSNGHEIKLAEKIRSFLALNDEEYTNYRRQARSIWCERFFAEKNYSGLIAKLFK